MTTVLLLEDNPDMLKVLGMMLEHSGYHVLYGQSAQEGLALLCDDCPRPDVIISDMVMPLADGMSLLEEIRKTPDLLSIPFILMSAFPSQQVQQQAFQMGADAFISKPFQFDTLHNILRNLGLETRARA